MGILRNILPIIMMAVMFFVSATLPLSSMPDILIVGGMVALTLFVGAALFFLG